MAIRVGIGLGRWPFEGDSGFRRWLDLCESGPIDSIWQSDRVLSREPFPEPLSLLAVIAGATRRLKIGMNAVVIGFRDPLTFARQCASVDFLSGGRLLPVIGVGHEGNPAWHATGRLAAGRGRRANEALEIITRLWREENVSFEGESHRVRGATVSPRPIQQPLPLWIGGSSPAAIRRTVRYGTGWLAGLQSVDEAIDTAAAIRAQGKAMGKPIPEDHYGATLLYRIGSRSEPVDAARGPGKLVISGSAEDLVEHIGRYAAGGITKLVAIPMAADEAELMEQTRLLAEEVLPAATR